MNYYTKIIKEIRYEDQVLASNIPYRSIIYTKDFDNLPLNLSDDGTLILPEAADGYVPICISIKKLTYDRDPPYIYLYIYIEKRRFKDKDPQALLSKIPRLHIDTPSGSDVIWESEGFLIKKFFSKIFY